MLSLFSVFVNAKLGNSNNKNSDFLKVGQNRLERKVWSMLQQETLSLLNFLKYLHVDTSVILTDFRFALSYFSFFSYMRLKNSDRKNLNFSKTDQNRLELDS